MVTAKDIKITLDDLSKSGGKFLVGDIVSGKLKIDIPGKLAVWRIELRMGDQKATVGNDIELKRGTNFIPFTFPKPLDNFDFKGKGFNIDHNLEIKLFPSRIRNERTGDAYLRDFSGATSGFSAQGFNVNLLGFKQVTIPFSVLRGDARYQIPARRISLNGKDRSWWLFLMGLLFTSVMFVPNTAYFPWFMLLCFLPFLYILEGDYVGRHLFGHLLAEVRTDHKGFPHLHLEPRGAGEEFLDARIGFRIRQTIGVGDDAQSSEIFKKSVLIRDTAIRTGKYFRVPLPFPAGKLPATYRHDYKNIEWDFYLEYPRTRGKNIRFRIPVKVSLAQLNQIPLPEQGETFDDVLELEPLREKQLNRRENGR